MLATTLSSHWAKDWPRNSSQIKKLLESRRLSWSISVSPSPMVSNLIVCLIEVEELRQKRTNEDKSTPIWSDFAKQHNQGAIRGFILQHRLIVCDRSLNDFFPAGWSSAKSSNPWLLEARCCIIPRLKMVISCEKVSKCALPRASHTKHHHLKDTPQNTTPKTVVTSFGWIIF